MPAGLILEDDRPEFKWIGGTYLMGGVAAATAIITTRASTGLFNLSKNVIGVVTRISINATTASVISYRISEPISALPAGFVVTASGPMDTRDARLINPGGSVLQVASANNVAGTGGSVFDRVTAQFAAPGGPIIDREPIILGPGSGLVLEDQIVEVNTLTVGFRWYERAVRAEELATP